MNVVHLTAVHHEISDPRGGRVGRKRDARTSAILDEAMRILAGEGLEALTLGRLARSLDLVPAALYRYFASKDALIAALQRRAVSAVHARLRTAIGAAEARAARSSPETSAVAKLLAAARAYLALPRTDPEAYFLVALLVGDPRHLVSDEESRRTAPLLLALLAEVNELFRRAAELRALSEGDGTQRTLAFWAVLQGALSLEKARRIAPAFPSASAVAGSAVASMLVGWGAPATTVRRAERLADEKKGRS